MREAFILTWKHPWMWFIGFLLMPQLLGESPFQFDATTFDEEAVLRMLIAIIPLALFAILLSFLANALFQPTLIYATAYYRAGTTVTGMNALRAGFEYLGRCLLLSLLWTGCSMLLIIMLVLPCVIAFLSAPVLGVVVTLLFIPIFLAALLAIYVLNVYSFRNVVMLNVGVGAAVQLSWEQFKSKIWRSLGLIVITTITVFVVSLPISILVTLFQLMMQFLGNDSPLVPVINYTIAGILSFFIMGYLGSFAHVIYTLAHQEWFLRDQEQESSSSTEAPTVIS